MISLKTKTLSKGDKVKIVKPAGNTSFWHRFMDCHNGHEAHIIEVCHDEMLGTFYHLDIPVDTGFSWYPDHLEFIESPNRVMKITRLGSDKDVDLEVEIITIVLGGKKFTLTDCLGDIKLHAHHGTIVISPCVSNEITISSK